MGNKMKKAEWEDYQFGYFDAINRLKLMIKKTLHKTRDN